MISGRLLTVLVTGLWVATLAFPAGAQSSKAKATANVDLQERLKEVQRDPKQTQALTKVGQKVAAVCDDCHGKDGNSPNADTPNLAGQNPSYHLEQLHQYATGQRKFQFMEGMVKVMTSDEKIGMVLYYANQKVLDKSASNPALAAKGKALYTGACVGCHDQDGHGSEILSRVAGQQPVYLHKALKRYRAGTGLRLDMAMSKAIQRMSDADVDAVVDYMTSMR